MAEEEVVTVGISDGETGSGASSPKSAEEAQTMDLSVLDEINSKLDLLLQAYGIEQEETE